MMPYIMLFVALFFCGLQEVTSKTRTEEAIRVSNHAIIPLRRICLIIPIAILLFIGIFRETTVGYDTETYIIYYWQQVDRYSWTDLLTNFSIDGGFFAILKIIAVFTDDWWLARAILFTINFALYYSALKRETPYLSVSLLLFIGLSNLSLMMSILRQALAGAICLHAYRQLKKDSWIKCLLLILLAATIHKTALICVYMLCLYVFRMKKFSNIKLVVLSALAYIGFMFGIPLLISSYKISDYGDIAQQNGGYGMLLFMVVCIALMVHLMFITRKKNDAIFADLFNLSCGAIFIQLGALSWELLNRATVFFSIYWCLLIPKLISQLPQRARVKYYLIVALLFGFMFFYQLSDVEMFVMHKF